MHSWIRDRDFKSCLPVLLELWIDIVDLATMKCDGYGFEFRQSWNRRSETIVVVDITVFGFDELEKSGFGERA